MILIIIKTKENEKEKIKAAIKPETKSLPGIENKKIIANNINKKIGSMK